MLNHDAIEYFSQRAISLCESLGASYSSSMISNGTLWPEDASSFIERNRIRHVQFTLDGPREAHDKRRKYVERPANGDATSSFDEIVCTIDRLIGRLRIYLRINVDPGIGARALSLVNYFAARGWLKPGAKFFPYLASIGPMTEHCGFLGESAKIRGFQGQFDELNHQFQTLLAQHIDPREIQHLQYYPMTVKLNCAAVGDNGVVFGPDGKMYKCGLDVGVDGLEFDKLPVGSDRSGAPRPRCFQSWPMPPDQRSRPTPGRPTIRSPTSGAVNASTSQFAWVVAQRHTLKKTSTTSSGNRNTGRTTSIACFGRISTRPQDRTTRWRAVVHESGRLLNAETPTPSPSKTPTGIFPFLPAFRPRCGRGWASWAKCGR